MKSSIIITTIQALKLPFKLLAGLVRKRRKKTELEQKQWKHVRNFAPTHYSWQKSIGKKVKKKNGKRKKIQPRSSNYPRPSHHKKLRPSHRARKKRYREVMARGLWRVYIKIGTM